MKREAEVRPLLINNAIHLISTGGFEKATTKELTHCGGNLLDLKMNEVYIYRLFGSKEGLYSAAFMRVEQEIYCAYRDAVREIGDFEGNPRDAMLALFQKTWKFLLESESQCRYYVRYYYSIYFTGESLEKHQKHFNIIIDSFSSLFRESADVKAIMRSVFMAMLDFAICVYNGQIVDSENNRKHIAHVLYSMMRSYFKFVPSEKT